MAPLGSRRKIPTWARSRSSACSRNRASLSRRASKALSRSPEEKRRLRSSIATLLPHPERASQRRSVHFTRGKEGFPPQGLLSGRPVEIPDQLLRKGRFHSV